MAWWSRKIEEAHQQAVMGSVTLPDAETVEVGGTIKPRQWQVDAWRLWKLVGELHAPTSYLARVISRRLDFVIQESESSEESQLETDKSAGLLQTAMGETNLEEFIRLAALNIQVAGEFWLIQTEKGWSIVSVVAPKLNDLVDAARSAGLAVLRVYDPDPSDPNAADCGMRTAIDPAEDLLTLSSLSKAQSRSRIAQAGILIVPSEAQFAGDPLGAGLNQVMSAAIRDTASPAAVVPIKVTMPADLIEKIRHITFDRPYDDGVPAKIELATRRIALALDMPPEVLLGMQDSNHWSAWVSQDESYNTAIAPLAEKVAAVLEFIVLTSLQQSVTIVLDSSELQRRRPQTDDVLDAAWLGAISLAFVRESLGATEAETPTEDDLKIIQAMARGGKVDADNNRKGVRPANEDPPNERDVGNRPRPGGGS